MSSGADGEDKEMSPDMDWGCTSTFVLRLMAAQCERFPVFVPGIGLLYHIWAPKRKGDQSRPAFYYKDGVHTRISSKSGGGKGRERGVVYILKKTVVRTCSSRQSSRKCCFAKLGFSQTLAEKAGKDRLCCLIVNKESQS